MIYPIVIGAVALLFLVWFLRKRSASGPGETHLEMKPEKNEQIVYRISWPKGADIRKNPDQIRLSDPRCGGCGVDLKGKVFNNKIAVWLCPVCGMELPNLLHEQYAEEMRNRTFKD